MSQSISNKTVNINARQYVPDLNEMLSQCELNYFLVSQLIPELAALSNSDKTSVNKEQLKWELKTNNIKLCFIVTDVVRYTVTMNLLIQTPKIKLLKDSQLIVRLYHDAKMLEVMEGSGPSALKAIITQSANKYVDEKRQINRFIGECLRACHNKTVNRTH